jgi:hypothetical protein
VWRTWPQTRLSPTIEIWMKRSATAFIRPKWPVRLVRLTQVPDDWGTETRRCDESPAGEGQLALISGPQAPKLTSELATQAAVVSMFARRQFAREQIVFPVDFRQSRASAAQARDQSSLRRSGKKGLLGLCGPHSTSALQIRANATKWAMLMRQPPRVGSGKGMQLLHFGLQSMQLVIIKQHIVGADSGVLHGWPGAMKNGLNLFVGAPVTRDGARALFAGAQVHPLPVCAGSAGTIRTNQRVAIPDGIG